MRRTKAMIHHEVRLRAAAWARQLVKTHGNKAEAIVVATLKRPNLTEHERLAARYTRDALRNLRRLEGTARPPKRSRLRTFGSLVAHLVLLRRPAPPPRSAIGR